MKENGIMLTMMETLRAWVVGGGLIFMLCLMFGMLCVGVWRRLRRQMAPGMLAVFVVSAGVATVEAQKRILRWT